MVVAKIYQSSIITPMIIEVDEYKNKVSGYKPEESENFHIESAKLADKDFSESLKSRKYRRIVLMSGGTASGKTEFASSYLTKKDQLVYDGTLKDFKGFEIKLQKIKRYDKNHSTVKVILIIPRDWIKAFEAFLKRERKMRPVVFFDTHIRSKLTVARILKETKTRVEIYVSDVKDDTDKLDYIRLSMSTGRKSIAKSLIATALYLHKIAVENGIEINTNYDSM